MRRAAAHRRAAAEHSAGHSGCHLALMTGESRERRKKENVKTQASI